MADLGRVTPPSDEVMQHEQRTVMSCASELRIVADVFASEPLDVLTARWFVRRVLDVADRLDGKA